MTAAVLRALWRRRLDRAGRQLEHEDPAVRTRALDVAIRAQIALRDLGDGPALFEGEQLQGRWAS